MLKTWLATRSFLLLAIGLSAPASAGSTATATQSTVSVRLLAAQNSERRSVGLLEMEWDPALEAAAARYARVLAATGRWEHSPPEDRVNQGENLWMGTRSAFQPEEMVNDWLSERKAFRPGRFPMVSTSGNLADVGHYTQIIWPSTVKVGCAVSSSRDWDYLVCRYSQPGNVEGQLVGNPQLASR